MAEKRKAAPQELRHRQWLAAMGIKPLPPVRQKKSLPGQIGMFDGLVEDEDADTTAPEDEVRQ